MEFFENIGVDMELSDMSFSVSLDRGRGCEWGSRSGLSGLFAQKRNVMNPYFWQMIREIVKFKDDVIRQVFTYFYLLNASNFELYRTKLMEDDQAQPFMKNQELSQERPRSS